MRLADATSTDKDPLHTMAEVGAGLPYAVKRLDLTPAQPNAPALELILTLIETLIIYIQV